MPRFVYHSRLPGIVVPLIGISAFIAFGLFAIRTRIPDKYLLWLFIVFFAVSATVAFALYALLDRGTRRVLEVVFRSRERERSKKSASTTEGKTAGTKNDSGEFDWEIGPRGMGLIPHWACTLFFASLAAVVLASQVAPSRAPGYALNIGALIFCAVCAVITRLIWTTVVRFRIDGPVVTIERPYVLFGRRVSFDLTEIDQVDLTHWPHDRKYGKCITFTLHGGQRIKYSNADRVVGKVVRQLRLAIGSLGEVPHPLSDEAIR